MDSRFRGNERQMDAAAPARPAIAILNSRCRNCQNPPRLGSNSAAAVLSNETLD
jgi:hypothetical protein